MSRRRRQETLWIHKWSRPLIGAIAATGAALTGFLTYRILTLGEGAQICEGGCSKVLSSEWAKVGDVPLTVLGCLAYLAILILAVSPLMVSPANNKELRTKLEGFTWPLLFVGATGMMVFSGFLMGVLIFSLKEVCPYCIGSAIFTVIMFGLTLFGRRWDDRGKLLFSGAIIAMVALVGTLGLYTVAGGPLSTARAGGLPSNAGQAITTPSGEAEVALANHLTDIGATMYGLYWCPHCVAQKELFGETAYQQMPYVECDPNGYQSQTAVCQAALPEGRGFPTWEINGEFFSGTQSLRTLAEASGYDGPTNFINEGGPTGGTSEGG